MEKMRHDREQQMEKMECDREQQMKKMEHDHEQQLKMMHEQLEKTERDPEHEQEMHCLQLEAHISRGFVSGASATCIPSSHAFDQSELWKDY